MGIYLENVVLLVTLAGWLALVVRLQFEQKNKSKETMRLCLIIG